MRNNFLIYAYCRDDGTFYYIGKGTKRRPFDSCNRVIKPPKDWRRQKSESMKGKNNPFYGKSHSEESKVKIKTNRTRITGEKCYLYGKRFVGSLNPMYGKSRPDLAKRNRETKVCLGKLWYNNGQIEIRYLPGNEPKEFTKGRLNQSGRKWYNNGKNAIMAFPNNVPDGFVFGRDINKYEPC